MKKYIVLLFLVFSTEIFAQEKPVVLSIETSYTLEGSIDSKYPITMHLTTTFDVKTNKQTVTGVYYYNRVGKFIYLGESVLNNNSNITLKEYATSSDANYDKNSTGEFTGILSNNLIFKGIWKNKKNNFDFELKQNPNPKVQEREITKYSFVDSVPFHDFEFEYEVLQIGNPKKLSGIAKINKHLATPPTFYVGGDAEKPEGFDALYSKWIEYAENIDNRFDRRAESYGSDYDLTYFDNNILSLSHTISWVFPFSYRADAFFPSVIYSLDSGEIINTEIENLIYNVDDEKLLAIMRQKLRGNTRSVFPESNEKASYFYFERIRLNNNYTITSSGIYFDYGWGQIGPRSDGGQGISFTYEELKPFVKKDSELYYLFE